MNLFYDIPIVYCNYLTNVYIIFVNRKKFTNIVKYLHQTQKVLQNSKNQLHLVQLDK